MLPSQILRERKERVRQIAGRYPRLTNLRVCGSVARGEDSEKSDIDILVDPEPGATLFDMGGLGEELRELLGVPVDIISSNSRMSPALREALSKDAVSL